MRPPHGAGDWAWAAGLFEGEGCLLKGLRVQVQITDEDVIRRYAAIVGGSVLGPYSSHGPKTNGDSRKPLWYCTVNSWQAEVILDHFWPWLGERRRARALELGYEPNECRIAALAGVSP